MRFSRKWPVFDPKTAARLHVNDIGRQIQRSGSPCTTTGRTLTELHLENRAHQTVESAQLVRPAFCTDRENFCTGASMTGLTRCWTLGLRDEAQSLLDAGYPARPQADAVSRIPAHDRISRRVTPTGTSAVETMKQDTRRFAKRQMIWFRGDARVHWLDADGQIRRAACGQNLWTSPKVISPKGSAFFMNKSQLNLQDTFLNQVRKENVGVMIYLIGGVQLRGNVRGFDSFTILLDSPGKPTQLVYKHAVTSIVPMRPDPEPLHGSHARGRALSRRPLRLRPRMFPTGSAHPDAAVVVQTPNPPAASATPDAAQIEPIS